MKRQHFRLIQEDPPGPPPSAPKEPPKGYWVYHTLEQDPSCGSTSVCFWAFVIISFLIFIGLFLVYWLVPYPYYYPPPPPPPPVKVSEGGGAIPGLGVGAVEDLNRASSLTSCGPGEVYDINTHTCEVRVMFPSATDATLFKDSTHPCVSFYDHACGSWNTYNYNRLSSDIPRIDRSFGSVQRKNKQWLKTHIYHDARLKNFYASCVTTLVHRLPSAMEHTRTYRNHVIQNVMSRFNTLSDLPAALVYLNALGFTSPISVSVSEHPFKDQRITYWGTDGWQKRHANVTIVNGVFATLFDAAQATRKTELFIALNNAIEERRRVVEETTPKSLEQYVDYLNVFQTADIVQVQDVIRLSGEEWTSLLVSHGFPASYFINRTDDAWVRDLHFYKWFFRQFRSDYESWKAYIEYSILYHTSFDYFPKLPSNVLIRSLKTSWKRATIPGERITEDQCLYLTEQMLPGVVSKLFQTDVKIVERVQKLSENIRDTLVAQVLSSDAWIPRNETRAYLANKLERIKIRVGGSNHLWKEEMFTMTIDRYMQNLDVIRRDRIQRDWNPISPNRDDAQRFGAPLTFVNAMYSPTSNTISIFNGILQYPFVHPKYSDQSLYGTIGTVIAHEMGHALGPLGRQFDERGLFKPWKSFDPQADDAYNAKASCVMNEWKLPTCDILDYGRKTLEEDVADVIGVKAAFQALEGASTEFFYAFAQLWCSVATPQVECDKAKHDVHALPRIRVDATLKHMQAFRETFSCPSNHPETRNVVGGVCSLFG